MKTRFLLLFSILAIVFSSVQAGEVQLDEAKKVAINVFFEKNHQFGDGIVYDNIRIINTFVESENGMALYYAFDFEGGGFVIISGDDVYTPVIGYAYEGEFPKHDVAYVFSAFMQGYADLINQIRTHNLEADAGTKEEWTHLRSIDISALNTQKDNRDVAPLTSGMWDQSDPYNYFAPQKAGSPYGGRCAAGCVATAMSMIMYYYRYPINGTGSHSYIPQPAFGTLSANFEETFYAWDGMQDVIDNHNPEPIAELMYHCGISVNMGYCSNGYASGAYSYMVPNRLLNFWRYTSAMYHEKVNYTATAWMNILNGQIDNGKPLYYSGSSTSGGHAFVCDGYQGTDYHFNFGWSGYGNGYFALNNVGGYYIGQGCISNFYPSDPEYPYHAEGQTIITQRSGSFTDGSGPIDDYLDNQTASWLIDPQTEQDSVTDIDLSFTHFDLDAGDYVRVYDGATTTDPMIGEFTGSSLPSSLTSSGNKLLIVLETNSSGTAAGFKAEFESTSPKWCNGMTELTEPTGSFDDGSGSFYYHNGATCMWLIEPEHAGIITLYFNSFETQEDYDIVTVYDGSTQIASFSGSELPDAVEATSGSMFITWATNSTVNGPGWDVYYEINNVGISEDKAFGEVFIYPNPATNHLNINFNSTETQSFDLKMTSITGQLLYSERVENHSGKYDKTLDLGSFANGVYILSLSSSKGIITEKIVIR